MKLDAPFIRLPHRFDAAALAGDLEALPEEAWQAHPDDLAGHRVVPLIAAAGGNDLNRLEGAMQPTSWLSSLPRVAHLLAALDTVIGRSFLVRIEPGVAGETCVDAGRYWHRHARVFMPLVAGGEATWRCAGAATGIPAGEVWLLDTWRGYTLDGGSRDNPLVCLVADTVGSGAFWSVAAAADRPPGESTEGLSARRVRLPEDGGRMPDTETVRIEPVMPPAEQEALIRSVMADIRAVATDGDARVEKLEAALDQFARQWQGLWARHGDDPAGRADYRQALEQLVAQLALHAGAWRLPGDVDAMRPAVDMLAAHALREADGRPVDVIPARLAGALGLAAPAAGSEAAPAPAGYTGTAGAVPHATADSTPPPDSSQSPLRSVHTRSLPELLSKIASSLLVTTYQAGKLVIVREDAGRLNTHFRVYNRPMGLAADRGRLALGTAMTVEHYRNMAEVAGKLDPPGRHDAAFLPRRGHVTGNIDIHEMAFAGDELWLVNTRFSCLCTLDGEHSFVPRWRPPFVSGYAPEDRCHLNGLEIVDGKPKYVTALGATDTAGGWRENKAGGGILMDVESGEIVCRGLSMPHSPRWYDGKLWLLESGNGSLATVDPESGDLEMVCELPGFTRGLDFYGPFAFVGLSQVRESAVFSGIALTEKVSERNAGVWVVDLRSRAVVAFLRFEDAVQEVFAVSVLPGIRFPDVLAGNDAHVPISYALPDEALREVVRPAQARSKT